MPLDELAKLQNKKLRRQVESYQFADIVSDLWDEAGVTPEDIQTTDDLVEAPIFRKDDARKYQFQDGLPFGGRLALPEPECYERAGYIATSSGTTGTSTNLLFTEHDREIGTEWTARFLWQAGLRPGETLVNYLPARDPVFQYAQNAAHKIGAQVTNIGHNPQEAPRIVHVLEHFEPTVLYMLSSPAKNALDAHIEKNGLDPKEVFESVKGIFVGGEPFLQEQKAAIEEEWGVTLYEVSGGLEPRWLCMESEGDGRWLHVPDDYFYVEIVDPETGERLEEGERGEIVITSLSYEGMAHIRWGHDDIGVIRRGEFDDGRTGTQVKFLGRVGDRVRVEGKDLLPYDALKAVHDVEEMPNNFFQFYPDSSDSLRIRLAYHSNKTDDAQEFESTTRDKLERELEVPVEVVDVMTEADIRDIGPDHKLPRIVEE